MATSNTDNVKGLVNVDVISSLGSRNIANEGKAKIVGDRVSKVLEPLTEKELNEIADVAGLSSDKPIRVTMGNGRISINLALAISEVLGISLMYILGESDNTTYSRVETKKFLEENGYDYVLDENSEVLVLQRRGVQLVKNSVISLSPERLDEIKSINAEELAELVKAMVVKARFEEDQTALNIIKMLALS